MRVSVELRFELFPWQRAAVDRWTEGDRHGPFRGTLEIFTGGGKTLIALACWAEATRRRPGTRLAVVVPTEALARQWRSAVADYTTTNPDEIGLLGAGEQDDFRGNTVLISVINTAAKRLPELAARGPAAACSSSTNVTGLAHPRSGESSRRQRSSVSAYPATPDREDVDEDGEPIEYDEHVLGQKIGEVVSRFSLADARRSRAGSPIT